MKTLQISALSCALALSLTLADCYKPNAVPPDVDVTLYTTNLTQMAADASWSGTWDEKAGQWTGVEFKNLGGTEALKQDMLPAYVPFLAGDCEHADSSGLQQGELSFELWRIVDLLRANEDQGAKGSNVILVGEPGIDVDARVQALAWQIAKKCPGIPEKWAMREVISIDLGTLKADSMSKNMSRAAYMRVLRRILEKWGHNAIYYLNDFSEIAESGPQGPEFTRRVNVGDVLKLFLDHDANVIIEMTAEEYNDYSSRFALGEAAHDLWLKPLSSEVVLPTVAALAAAQSQKRVAIGGTVPEDIVRLTRAFLPARQALTQSTKLLGRVAKRTLESGHPADEDTVFEALASLHPKLEEFLASGAKEILDRNTTLADIDWNVRLSPKYYKEPLDAERIAKAVARELKPSFDLLEKRVKGVRNKLDRLEQKILDDLLAKSNLLRQRIASLGAKVDSRTGEIADKLVAQSSLIVAKYEALSGRVDTAKNEMLNRVVEAQGNIINFVNVRANAIDQGQRRMIEEFSLSHNALADAIGRVDVKVDNTSMAALERLADLELRLAQELEFLGEGMTTNQAAALAQVATANGALARLSDHLETLSKNESETYNKLLKTHELLSGTVVDHLKTLTNSQAGMFAKLAASEVAILGAFQNGHSGVLATLTNIQGEIAHQAEAIGKQLTGNQAAVLTEIATANGALARLSDHLETLSKNESETYNKLLKTHELLSGTVVDHLKTLTNSQAGMFAKLAASEVAIIGAFENGHSGVLATLTNIQGEIAHQAEAIGKQLTDNQAAVLTQIATVNQALAAQSDQLETLSKNESETYNKLLKTHELLSGTVVDHLKTLTNSQAGMFAKLAASEVAILGAFQNGHSGVLATLTNIQGEIAHQAEAIGKQLTGNQASVLTQIATVNQVLAALSDHLETLTKNESETYNKLLKTHDLLSGTVLKHFQTLTVQQTELLSVLQNYIDRATTFEGKTAKDLELLADKMNAVEKLVDEMFTQQDVALAPRVAILTCGTGQGKDRKYGFTAISRIGKYTLNKSEVLIECGSNEYFILNHDNLPTKVQQEIPLERISHIGAEFSFAIPGVNPPHLLHCVVRTIP